MTPAADYRKVIREKSNESFSSITHDRVMLHLARVAIVLMLSVIGFLINAHLLAIRKTMDDMTASIEKTNDTQAQMVIMLVRVDETVRNIDRRLGKNENRLDMLERKNP